MPGADTGPHPADRSEDTMATNRLPDRPTARAYPLAEVGAHIAEERRKVSVLGEVRELVFGAQDGLVSTLAVVATVAGATTDNLAVLVAGLASAMAGIFSMAVGEYMGSKSQAEIERGHLVRERKEVQERPKESEAEVAYLFMQEGMEAEEAWETAAVIARYPDSLLATMLAKELGLASDGQADAVGTPLRGAVVMGGAFAAGSVAPIAPFLFTEGLLALSLATLFTGLVLFAIGVVKSRWTDRFWLWSGLEIVALAAVAGVAGYLFGTVLPSLLGFAGVT
jgi:vacuolar iron transporter family protein